MLLIGMAPSSPGTFTIACNVSDGHGGLTSDSLSIEVVEYINNDPVITGMNANPRKMHLGSESEINCTANDPDGDTLNYSWSADLWKHFRYRSNHFMDSTNFCRQLLYNLRSQ